MKINIEYIKEEKGGYTKVSSANKELVVKKDSPTWTNEKINEFLIALATKDSEGKIEISYSEDIEDNIYLHIIELFKDFKKNYEVE